METIASIIIPNWNGGHFLKECFCALKNQSFHDFEVIFVDNASADGSAETAEGLLRELGLKGKVVRLPENTGFTGANAEGLKHCQGGYIALLNNDTEVSSGWLQALAEAMDSHPEVGICASKLIVWGTEIIDSAGDIFTTALSACKRGEGMPRENFSKPGYVFGACAGAALYRKSMLDEIGFFDEDFFLNFEDADLNFRAQLAGWKCFFVPEAVVYHKVGASAKKLGAAALYYAMRNSRMVVLKNVPAALMLWHLPCRVLDEAVVFLYHLKIGKLESYIKGNLAFLKNLGSGLRKRRRTLKLRKVSVFYINSLFTSTLSLYWKKYSRGFLHGRLRKAAGDGP